LSTFPILQIWQPLQQPEMLDAERPLTPVAAD
jgi:hypothetical protein